MTKCPLCGTWGEKWDIDDEMHRCPNCSSVYCEYGIVMESHKQIGEECS